jgi:hypothetical protein
VASRTGGPRRPPHPPPPRRLRPVHPWRRAGGADGRRLRGLGRTANADRRGACARRPGGHELADRELSRLPRRSQRHRAGRGRLSPGAAAGGGVPDRGCRRPRAPASGRNRRGRALERLDDPDAKRRDRNRGRLPPPRRPGNRGADRPRRTLRQPIRRGRELSGAPGRGRRRGQLRRTGGSLPRRPCRPGHAAGSSRIARPADVAVPGRADRAGRSHHGADRNRGGWRGGA